MKAKLPSFKILFSSLIISYANFTYADSISDLIQSWKKMGNFLIFSIPVKPDPMIPNQSINAHSKLTLPLIFEPLTSVNAQQELQPVLAKSWLISSDQKSITITLKSDHYFSDHTEVTAYDVANSIKLLCSRSSQAYDELHSLVGCESSHLGKGMPEVYVVNKYQVKFNIDSSPTTFLYQLASPSTVIVKQTRLGLIGSGQYRIKEQKDNYIILDKNPTYPKNESAKNAGIILFYSDHADLSKLLKQAQFDGALMYRVQASPTMEEKNYKRLRSNANITEILVLNNQKFPLNKKILRNALASAIYNSIQLDTPSGERKAFGIIPRGLGGSINNIQSDYLPEITSAEVFNKIPFLKNNKVSLTINEFQDFKDPYINNKIIQAGKKYNIDIKFKLHTNYAKLWSLYGKHKLDAFIELYVFKNLEAYQVIRYFTKNGPNDANISNETLDKMFTDALAAPASHDRFQVYRQIAQYIQNESLVIPLFYMDHDNIVSKCLLGIRDEFFINPFSNLPEIEKIKNCND